MKPVRIDFAPPTAWRALALTSRMTWLAIATGLALCGSAAVVAQRSAQQAGAWEAKRAAVIAEHAPARRPAASGAPVPAAQATAVNGIVARLNVPWRDLFQTMEAATPADRIALLEVTPDPVRHTLRGTAEARNSEEMLAYMTRLAAQPFFTTVTLTSHEINLQDANRPLRFQFAAQWRGDVHRELADAPAAPKSASAPGPEKLAGRQP